VHRIGSSRLQVCQPRLMSHPVVYE
jgi:hypothetical protein